MRVRDAVIGVLSIVGTSPGALAPGDLQVARAFADIAAITLLTRDAVDHADTLNAQLQSALTTRGAVDRATGVVAATEGLTLDHAFDLLRSESRRTRVRLVKIADAINEGRITPAGLIAGLPSREQRTARRP